MAKNFGGRYSPDGQQRDHRNTTTMPEPHAPIRHRLAGRPKWVTIAASPFLLTAFFQQPIGMVSDLLAFGLVAAGMWMTGEGLKAEAVYETRRIARRPAFPRKLFGGIIAALGFGIGAAAPDAIAGAGLIGITALVLHWMAFGADPMRDKGIAAEGDFQQSRADRMIAEGEDHLAQMQQAIARTGDRRLQARVGRFATTVEDLFERVRANPGDLSAARRYMGVYLMGARDATEKFANLYLHTRDMDTRRAYETFLDDLEKDFSAQSDKLLAGNRADLDIEISVLRDRLAREGVRPADPVERPALTTDTAQTLDDLINKAGLAHEPERDPVQKPR